MNYFANTTAEPYRVSIRREVENERLRQARFPKGTDQEQISKGRDMSDREVKEAIKAFCEIQPAECATEIGAEEANYCPEMALVWAARCGVVCAVLSVVLWWVVK